MQQGFKPEKNVVSLFLGWDIRQGHGAKGAGAIENPMFDEQISSMFHTLAGTFGAVVVCDPLVAKRLVEQGYGASTSHLPPPPTKPTNIRSGNFSWSDGP
jgi:hypothetical protein